jgi:predicted nuclease with TOPRIM domain
MHIEEIAEEIDALEAERSTLRRTEMAAAAQRPDDLPRLRARLEEIRVRLDQLFDLRHQRQGAVDRGGDPDREVPRDEGTVEGYLG